MPVTLGRRACRYTLIMQTNWQKIRSMPARDQVLLAGMVVLVPIMDASLKMMGYRKTRQLAECLSSRRSARSATPHDIDQGELLGQIASIAGRRGLVEASCLRQALAVYLTLRWRGLSPKLELGVDRRGARPDMHAWVELGGRRLAQQELRHRTFKR